MRNRIEGVEGVRLSGEKTSIGKTSQVKWNFWCPDGLTIGGRSARKIVHAEGCNPIYRYESGGLVPESLVDKTLDEWLKERDERVKREDPIEVS